jgi:hypothetical protein
MRAQKIIVTIAPAGGTRRPDHEAACDPEIYRIINQRIRDKCDNVIKNSTGCGVHGDMVKQAPKNSLLLDGHARRDMATRPQFAIA